jgi:hypothetical protein
VLGVVGVVLLLPPPQPIPAARNANKKKVDSADVLPIREGNTKAKRPANITPQVASQGAPRVDAVAVEEARCAAVVDTVSVAFALIEVALRSTDAGLMEQVVSWFAGVAQARATVPAKPLAVATVRVEVPDFPAAEMAMVEGLGEMV